MFALIVTGKETRSSLPDRPIVAYEGKMYWVVVDREGWVPASSVALAFDKEPPVDLKTFPTREEAEAFGSTWKGHPWWCVPKSFKVVEVEPKYETITGYRVVEKKR